MDRQIHPMIQFNRFVSRFGHGVFPLVLSGLLLVAGVTPAFASDGLYQVSKGDTLFRIATRFGVSVWTLVTNNSISDPNLIWPGQTLRVPSGQAAVDIQSEAATPRILSAPYHSQFDDSIWAPSNCGPTSLSMALGAIGIQADQISLRQLANAQMHNADPNLGTTWESLAYAAKQVGARTYGLYDSRGYRSWSIKGLKQEIARGRPMLLLVRYRDLPEHRDSTYAYDHYIVVLGFDSAGDVVYHDPAYGGDAGADRHITVDDLTHAWSDTSVGLNRTAMAIGSD